MNYFFSSNRKSHSFCALLLLLSLLCAACGSAQGSPEAPEVTTIPETSVPASPSSGIPASEAVSDTRDNTPLCLVPEASGVILYSNDIAVIDASNTSEGYVCVRYLGNCPKVKLQVTAPNGVTYSYNLIGNGFESFPLSCGSGTYALSVCENIAGNQYSLSLYEEISVTITNEFGPFLYPNQYVKFHAGNAAVAKAEELALDSACDLDVISNVYNYVVASIVYDYDKAQNVASGYTSDIDSTLQSGTGICLDYAAVMASMLRSQGIPTHLEVGYAKEAYHAWISVYADETGWINGIIEFDGQSWSLMDPTFASNSSEKQLKKFIGDGSNYTVKYIY